MSEIERDGWKVTVLPTVMPPERKPKLKKKRKRGPKGLTGTPMGGRRGPG